MIRPFRLTSLIGLSLFVATTGAEDRVALVIGNSKYDGDAALKNPVNDAESVAAALAKLNFKVTKATDVDLAQFEEAVVGFSRGLKKDSVAFFFYAGHGVQVKGENFLVPLKADLKEEFQAKQKCYKVDYILEAMDASSAALKVVVLDCCRDNPFTRGWTRGAGNKGLATITDIPDGSIIAFSTAPGKTALDGRGRNSPYTAHLVAALGSRPAGGLEITQALRTTAQAVNKEVGQRPWIDFDAATAEYYLWKDGDAVAAAPLPPITPTPNPAPSGLPANSPQLNYPGGPQTRLNLLELAMLDPVRKELRFSAEAEQNLSALSITYRTKAAGEKAKAAIKSPSMTADELFAKEFQPQLQKMLSAAQFRRLEEIRRQNLGWQALTEPSFVAQLGLSDDQRNALNHAFQNLVGSEQDARVPGILTDEQKRIVQTAMGVPFDVSGLQKPAR